MAKLNKKIGFLGAGNMGEAFVGALIRSGLSDPSMIYMHDVLTERLETMKKTYGVSVMDNNSKVFSACDVVILAVKPQQTVELLSEITSAAGYSLSNRKLFISIAAGIPIRKIESSLYTPLVEKSRSLLPIVRVMPNTPALVLAGMSGMSPNRYATADDIQTTRTILGAIGCVVEFKEEDLDAVTALSGSGPAYVFYLIESMIAGGIANGLTTEDATTLTLQTLSGAVKLMQDLKADPVELRRRVTSPGGTTEAALNVLEGHNVKNQIVTAISAATRRSKELSQ